MYRSASILAPWRGEAASPAVAERASGLLVLLCSMILRGWPSRRSLVTALLSLCWPLLWNSKDSPTQGLAFLAPLSPAAAPRLLQGHNHHQQQLGGALVTTGSSSSSSSSMRRRRGGGCVMLMDISIMSANVLAPIYYRIDKNGTREAEYEERYMARHQVVLDNILKGRPDGQSPPDVICLQEWWVRGKKLREAYLSALCQERGYRFVEVERTNDRGDGVACFVSPRLELVDSRPILFLDCGDRVGLLVRVRVTDDQPAATAGEKPVSCEALVINTHLLFPHNPYSTRIRLREVQKALGFVDKYKNDEELGPLPIFFVGDLNGSPKGEVARYLREKGFKSAFETYNSGDEAKLQSWISHRSHRGQYVGVDYIWHLPPQNQSKPLAADWRKLVFSEIQKELPSAVRAAFRVFDSDDNLFITPDEFKSTLKRLGFSGEGRPALTDEEIDFLFATTDKDGNQMVDFKEFTDRFWELDLYLKEDGYYVPNLISPQAAPPGLLEGGGNRFEPSFSPEEEAFFMGKSTLLDNVRTLHINKCSIYPPDMEMGTWPPDYTSSDHGFLSVDYHLEPSLSGEE